jgi:hypothetical protein
MRILLATRLESSAQERADAAACMTWLQERTAGIEGAVVMPDSALDWKGLRRLHGGYFGAYKQVAHDFDRIVLIAQRLHGGLYVGRGQFSIARNALDGGKVVGVWAGDRVARVSEVEVNNRDDWKGSYGVVVLHDPEGGA